MKTPFPVSKKAMREARESVSANYWRWRRRREKRSTAMRKFLAAIRALKRETRK